MATKIYTNRKKAGIEVLQLLGWGVLGILALFILNLLTNLIGIMVVPHLLVIPIFFFFAALYRNIWLYFVPMIVITKQGFRYFNVLYYKSSDWASIHTVYLSKEKKQLILMQDTGRVLQTIDLDTLSETDYSNLLETILTYKEIVFE